MTGSRDITPDTLAAATAPTIYPVLFVKMEFDGGDVCLHSQLGTLSFAGDTYTGVGKLGGITPAEEVSDLSSSQVNLTLSGLPLDLVSILFNEQYQGRRATVFLGYLDPETNVLVDTPTILYRGLLDTADFSKGKTFATTVSVGSRFAAWGKPQPRRYNNADQQARYPGDTGLQYIDKATYKTVIWGAAR
ncbi:MAG TPA: hypothetical protein VD866_05530 [Urbifossiella sp.]|nr:hypothetical protein [Urbifossiella sp.]